MALRRRRPSGWAGEVPIEAVGRLGAGHRGRSVRRRTSTSSSTRYGSTKPCPGNCPTPYIALDDQLGRRRHVGCRASRCVPARAPASSTRSSRSCPARARSTPLYMNGFNIMFTKSTEPWRDLVGAGQDVRQRLVERQAGHRGERQRPGRLRLVQRPDRRRPVGRPVDTTPARPGAQVKLVDSDRYYFAFDADVAPDGTVYFARVEPPVRRRRQQGHDARPAPIDEHVFISRDHGRDLDEQGRRAAHSPGLACTAAGCTPDFYLGHDARHGRRRRQARVRCTTARRRAGGQAVDLRHALDRPRDDVVDPGRDLDRAARRRPRR